MSSHLVLLVETREFEYVAGFFEGRSLEKAKEQFERRYIHGVLLRTGWDIERAAGDLGMTEDRLRERMSALNITFVA